MFDPWPSVLGVPLGVWLFGLPLALAVVAFALRDRLAAPLAPLWRGLDALYFAAGLLGAACLLAILTLSTLEMLTRDLLPALQVRGGKEWAAYAMATSTFLVLPHALNRGAHIRVSVLLNATAWTRRWVDLFALAVSAIIATYFARFMLLRLDQSHAFSWWRTDDRDTLPNGVINALSVLIEREGWSETLANSTPGFQPVPFWLVLIPICFGAVLFAVCLWDNLYRVIITGENRIKSEGV